MSATGSLYVGDLNDDVTEGVLFETFKVVGPIISIRVCRDAVTRRTLGYAYVNFSNPVDAERALETLNYAEVKGRNVRLMWSQRDPALRKSGAGNVFIKNLDSTIDNKVLAETFSAFGNILSCKVVCDAQGVSRGYGFVHFESEESAKDAIQRVDGMLLNEKKVFVGPFVKRQSRLNETLGNFTNLYVKELALDIDADMLREKFSKFGEVTSTCAKKHPKLDKVYGFVNFAEHKEAVQAVEAWHDQEVEGVSDGKLYVQRAMRRSEREQLLRRQLLDTKAKRQFPPGNNLYVKNLEEHMTDADLRAQFAVFGEINSACVMKDKENGSSRGFGFVCFATADASNKALSEMNGKMVGTKPLYVNVAQRKEVRRSMLELQYAQRSRGPQPSPGQFGAYPFQPGYGGFYGYGARPPGAFGSRTGQPMGYPGAPPGMRRPGASRGGGGGWPTHSSRGGGGPPMSSRGKQPGYPPRPGMPGMGMGMPFNQMGMMPMGNPPMPGQRRTPQHQPADANPEPLTAENLAAMSPEQQKNALGEQLYHKISGLQPSQAAKITGMLLEMDVSETLNLLESPDLLNSKISEALAVLRAHEQALQ